MELIKQPKRETLSSLIDLATKGFYPLFHSSWIEEACLEKPFCLTKKQLHQAAFLMQRVAKQSSIERKKTVVLALKDQERKLFIKAFLTLVESRLEKTSKDYH